MSDTMSHFREKERRFCGSSSSRGNSVGEAGWGCLGRGPTARRMCLSRRRGLFLAHVLHDGHLRGAAHVHCESAYCTGVTPHHRRGKVTSVRAWRNVDLRDAVKTHISSADVCWPVQRTSNILQRFAMRSVTKPLPGIYGTSVSFTCTGSENNNSRQRLQ